VTLEIDVLRWFAAMVGYGPGFGGLLTSGGSLANLAAVVAARHRRFGEGDFRAGRIYVSGQTHHSVHKAARVAGFPADSLVPVEVDAQHRLDPRALVELVARDRSAGLAPLLVVASAGSTAMGAVDDLSELADRCAAEGLWLHVDAAYGGFFALTERGRARFAGLDRADSIALDPHKGLFLPYGTGCVLVRRRADLREAHAVGASYLPASQDDELGWDFADLGPELSRPFRGLRVWLPLVLHGFGPFRAALDEKLDLARVAAEAVRSLPGVRLVSEPVLSLFSFRWDGPDDERVNRRWLAAVNARRRVFLSGATAYDPARGRDLFVLRVCILSFRTHADRVEALIVDLTEALAEVIPAPHAEGDRQG
jgi:aromatic-L-amino-acid decarboxylase